MPLEKGPVGSDAFGRSIATEEKAGKPPKQAEAIAYSEAGEKKDSSMDRLDSILADCDKMEKRVDALCASRKDVESVEPGQKVKITYGDSVYDLVSAREAGKKAEKAGKPITANPFPKRMSDTDPDQIRKHDSWESGWEYSRDAASGWEPHAGQM